MSTTKRRTFTSGRATLTAHESARGGMALGAICACPPRSPTKAPPAGSACLDRVLCREPAHIRADSVAILGEHALPRFVQVDPLRRLSLLPAEWRVAADDGSVGQAPRWRPVGAERADRASRRH